MEKSNQFENTGGIITSSENTKGLTLITGYYKNKSFVANTSTGITTWYEFGKEVEAPEGVTVSWNKDVEIGKDHKFNM